MSSNLFRLQTAKNATWKLVCFRWKPFDCKGCSSDEFIRGGLLTCRRLRKVWRKDQLYREAEFRLYSSRCPKFIWNETITTWAACSESQTRQIINTGTSPAPHWSGWQRDGKADD